jgi:hypothetical protein
MSIPKGLTIKLVSIMKDLGRIQKNGRNDFQGYDYVTESDIMDAVREKLAAHNVFIFSSVINSSHEGELTTVTVAYTITDGDTGEAVTINSVGQGKDKGDKGVYKAITGAYKYFLMKTFLMSSGDDPETDDGPMKRKESSKSAPVAKSEPSVSASAKEVVAPKAASTGFKRPTTSAPKPASTQSEDFI